MSGGGTTVGTGRTAMRWHEVPLLLASVLVLTLIYLWFRGYSPAEHYIGAGSLLDWNTHYWHGFAWGRFYLGQGGAVHSNWVFYPDGVSFLTMNGDPLVMHLRGLLALMGGADFSYVCIVFFVLLGNAAGGYLLARGLGGSIAGASAAAAICTFNPFVGWCINSGNPEYAIWLFNCLFFLFFLRLLEGGRWRDIAYTTLFAVLATLTNYVFVIPLAIFCLVLLPFFRRCLIRDRVIKLAVVGLATLILMAPLIIAFVAESRERGHRQNWGTGEVTDGLPAASAMEPYVDSSPLPDFLPWNRGPGGRAKVGTTFSLWILLAAGLMFGGRGAIPWAAAAGVFALLSLGPTLKLGPGPPGGPGSGTLLPFYYLLEYVPLFHRFQFPSRMFSFTLPGAAVVAGLGLSALPRMGRLRFARFVPAAVVAAVTLELLFAWPLLPGDRPEVHRFYAELPDNGNDFGIIEVPFNFTTIDSDYQYNQTRHGIHLFNGTFAPFFAQDPTGGLVSGNLFLLRIRELQSPLFERNLHIPPPAVTPDPLPRQETMSAALTELHEAGFRYILVHRVVNASRRPVRFDSTALEAFLGDHLGPPILRDGEMSVFEMPGTNR